MGRDSKKPGSDHTVHQSASTPSEDVAIALGHQDGGNLVRRLYGHRDKGRALDRIVGVYAARAENRRTRSQSSGTAEPQQSLFGDTYV